MRRHLLRRVVEELVQIVQMHTIEGLGDGGAVTELILGRPLLSGSRGGNQIRRDRATRKAACPRLGVTVMLS